MGSGNANVTAGSATTKKMCRMIESRLSGSASGVTLAKRNTEGWWYIDMECDSWNY